jgi:hypothetical protein
MRLGAFTQWNTVDLSSARIEPTEHACVLARVPDRAVRRRRHIVRMVALRHIEIVNVVRNRSRCRQRKRQK